MHEMSLVSSLLKQVDRIRLEHSAERVREIRVEVGPMSGVEPLLLRSAYEQLATDFAVEAAELVIEEVPLLARCRHCDATFEVNAFSFRCTHCAATDVQVTRGDGFQLVSVTIQARETSTGAAS